MPVPFNTQEQLTFLTVRASNPGTERTLWVRESDGALMFGNTPLATSTGIGGPGSTTDNALVRWDGTTGTAVQDSSWLLGDSNQLVAGGILDLASTYPLTNATTVSIISQVGPVTDPNTLWINSADGHLYRGSIDLEPAAGDVSGPGTSTDNAWPRWDGSSGTDLQDGKWVEEDSGAVTAGGNLSLNSTHSILNTLTVRFVATTGITDAATLWINSADGHLYRGTTDLEAEPDGVTGPATSTINALARWGDTSGDSLLDSSWVLDGANNLTAAGNLLMSTNNITSLGSLTFSASGTVGVSDVLTSTDAESSSDAAIVTAGYVGDRVADVTTPLSRVDSFTLRKSPAADSTVDSLVFALDLKTESRQAICDTINTGISPYTDARGQSVRMYANGGSAAAIDVGIKRIRYDSGTTAVIFDLESQTSGTTTVNVSITADNTWRTLLSLDAGGADLMSFQVKTDGDDVQFRMASSGISADPYYYEVGFNMNTYPL